MKPQSRSTAFFNNLGRKFAYFYVRRLMQSDIEWTADVPEGPKIIASNHPTTADPFLMMSWPFDPIYILITEDAFKIPVVGHFLRLAGHIPVYAGRGREALDAAVDLLKNGKTIGIFPEGALTENYGNIGPTHTGTIRLAATTNAPIIPMGIALDRHFVTTHDLNHLGVKDQMRWFGFGAYEITLGKPLYINHDLEDRDAVKQSTGILSERIDELINQSANRLLQASWPVNHR